MQIFDCVGIKIRCKSCTDYKKYFFRKVYFTLCVDGSPFVKNIEGLNKAILAFLYISFIADLEYPQVQNLCMLVFRLQMMVKSVF